MSLPDAFHNVVGSLADVRGVSSRQVLGQNQDRIRSDPDIGAVRHVVEGSPAGSRVVTRMVTKICAVSLPVTVQPDPPLASPWHTDRVAVISAVREIRHDDDIVAHTATLPAVEGDDFIRVIDVVDVEMLAS